MYRHLVYIYVLFFFILVVSCKKNAINENDKKYTHVEKLFETGEDVYQKPKIREHYIDSALGSFSGNDNDSITRFFYRRATVAYYDLRVYDKALHASHLAFDLGLEANDSLTMAKASYFSGISHSEKNHIDSAFFYYAQAEKLFRDINDKSLLGEIGLYKAYIYHNIGEYVLCESEAIKALRLLEEKQSSIDIYKCNNLIGSALLGQGNFTESIKYYRSALDQLENLRKEGYPEEVIAGFRASSYNNLSHVYLKQEDYPKSIGIYQEALAGENVNTMGASLYAKLLNNLAYAKFKSGIRKDVPEMLYRSLRIRDSINDMPGVVASHISLGEYFTATGNPSAGITYLKTAYDEAKRIKSNDDILTSSKLLSDIDPVNGQFYAEQYIDLSIKMQNAAKANREKFARIEYETDKLQNEKEALARKNSYIIGISLIVLFFIAAIFMIYYLNSRNKELLLIQEQQKANEEIYQLMFEQQSNIETARSEEKNRIAMELHDGILNNIYAVRLNLEFINKKSDDESVLKRKEYIKELQSVESEIRAVSHDLSRNDIFSKGQDFGAMLHYMITSQKNNFNTGFDAHIDTQIDWETISNTNKINIYRIVQEALQNINKYSQARYAGVEIMEKDNKLSILVNDDGIGFEPEKVKGGIGLRNLRKRAEALKGILNIRSNPGKGSSIEVVFPLS
ncbi:ATP-binding protein [Flavobacterium sp. MFBS3-15]|uniref:ATP-binding protein n=1 Tax=Flavobacterium sp. MFBS3-15 TaxID=2989816 RepID=UPI0022368D19|nr:ATP-binding protein [Flavobacterium sp. MFBS3-15]MCW4468322.1 ATP-binding protein [Flavobacterium sp. MFBS3-15]